MLRFCPISEFIRVCAPGARFMIKVSHLIRFLQELKPQGTPTRLAFFNYVKNFGVPESALTPELVDQFFLAALDYPHWYSHRSQLGNEVELLLENFNSYFQNQFPIHLVKFPQSIQIIEVEQVKDWQEVAEDYLSRLARPQDRFQLLVDPLKRGLGLILRHDGSLELRFFDRKMVLRLGQLEPLRKDLVLFFTPQLELSPEHQHKMDLGPQMTVQFEVSTTTFKDPKASGEDMVDVVTGCLVRGYFFQRVQSFERQPITDIPKLFVHIKKLEQHFVDSVSDPYLKKLKSQLEKAISQLVLGDGSSREWSHHLLSQSEIALEQIYAGDKRLEHLIKELRELLMKDKAAKNSWAPLPLHPKG